MSAVNPRIARSAQNVSWGDDETATARNLFERAVTAPDIAASINALYGNGRTANGVRSRMHTVGAIWGCAVRPDERDAALSVMQIAGRQGGLARAALVQAENRPKPWHPLHDNPRLLTILEAQAGAQK